MKNDLNCLHSEHLLCVRSNETTCRRVVPDDPCKAVMGLTFTRVGKSARDFMLNRAEPHITFRQKRDVYDQFVQEYAKLEENTLFSWCYFEHVGKEACSSIKIGEQSKVGKRYVCRKLDSVLRACLDQIMNSTDLGCKKLKNKACWICA